MKKLLTITLALLLVAGFAFAGAKQEAAAPTVLKCAFIGGANYEELYKEIPKWEAKTGMKVEIVYKGDGFQIDKKLKTDFAAGSVDYDVCWDHSSFFTQYIKADGIVPLDDYFSADELKDFIPDESVEALIETVDQSLLAEQVEEVLDTLPPREARILRLRFGLEDSRSYTLEEVAEVLGLTRERIRQIQNQALRRLRHPKRARLLRDYV